MKVEKAVSIAGAVVVCILGVALTNTLIAAMLRDGGGFLADLAAAQATLSYIISDLTIAAMGLFIYRVLSRQPDHISSAANGRGQIYREYVQGAIVYQNVAGISSPVMTIHSPDQEPPCIHCESEENWLGDNGHSLPVMPSIEAFDGSLHDVFQQNGGTRL